VETALRHDLAWRPVTLAERQDRRHVRTAAGEVGPAVYIGPLATCFLASVAVALLARVTGASGIAEGLLLGVVIGVGIAGGAVRDRLLRSCEAEAEGVVRDHGQLPSTGLGIAAVIVTIWT
jgi:hypothetical protein